MDCRRGCAIPTTTYDQAAFDYNTSNYFVYTITNIVQNSSGNFVTYSTQTSWKNGSLTTTTTIEDIENAVSDYTVMPINLEVGTTIRPEYDWSALFGGTFSWVWPARTVTSSTNMTYGVNSRVVDICDFTQPPLFGSATTRQIYKWDKAIGVQV